MKESGEWNPYYMCSPYGFCHEQRTFPWLYPYGNQMNYWKLWNFPEKMEEEEDARRLSEMYPIMAKRLQPYVEEICIQLEYPGSMMYDEYPDQLSLMKKSREIWKLAQEREQFGEAAPEWEQDAGSDRRFTAAGNAAEKKTAENAGRIRDSVWKVIDTFAG